MLDDRESPKRTGLRPPAQVMRLHRMGAAFPTRLSFLRILMRRLAAENAYVERVIWRMDDTGFGHAVYTVTLGGHPYSLVAISSDLPPEARSDRVIAEAWDAAFVLYDGVPSEAEIARIAATAPRQEAARFTLRDLVLSRANKSVRLFDHVVSALRAGQQPSPKMIGDIGYLMRTTAVYGNGKFGIADRAEIASRPGLDGPFMAEMLTVWLIRGFTHDLAEHVGGGVLDPALKRHLGIGNSTGLGMAPFLVSHPNLLNAWVMARETALARVLEIEALTPSQITRLTKLAARAARHFGDWAVADQEAQGKINQLRQDWTSVQRHLSKVSDRSGSYPLRAVWNAAEKLSIDTQEALLSLLIEPFGDLVDDLTATLAPTHGAEIEPAMSCAELAGLITRDWSWALLDYSAPDACAQFWYVSQAKAEPRLGFRHDEPGADRESPLDIARRVSDLAAVLWSDGPVASFLSDHPEHRAAVRRVQAGAAAPYAEIRDNLISKDCRPIDMLRFKLAFFGAAKFDPKSDRWTRITLCQGAPLAGEWDRADDWWLPEFDA